MNAVNCVGWGRCLSHAVTPTRIASLSALPTMGEVKSISDTSDNKTSNVPPARCV